MNSCTWDFVTLWLPVVQGIMPMFYITSKHGKAVKSNKER